MDQCEIYAERENQGDRGDGGRKIHAVSSASGVGDNYPQESGTYFRTCYHRRFSFFYPWSDLCALSRCKTLEGMVLSQPLSRGAIISSQTVDAFTSQLAAPSQEQISSLELQYIIYCITELFDFYSIRTSYEHLMRCLIEFFNGKYPRVVSEYQKLQVVLKSLIAVSDKFRVQYTGMLARNPDVRQAELQDRIHKGAMYFLDKIGILSDLIRKIES